MNILLPGSVKVKNTTMAELKTKKFEKNRSEQCAVTDCFKHKPNKIYNYVYQYRKSKMER